MQTVLRAITMALTALAVGSGAVWAGPPPDDPPEEIDPRPPRPSPAPYWLTVGNAYTHPSRNFLGTTDNNPLELRANNSRALRLWPVDAWGSNFLSSGMNVLAGHANNEIWPGVSAATIAGGGGSIGFGGPMDPYPNLVTDVGGTVGGGMGNAAGDWEEPVDSAPFATVGGGRENYAGGYATVGGGLENEAEGRMSVVPGGVGNRAGARYSFAAGVDAWVRSPGMAGTTHGDEGTFVWADASDLGGPYYLSTGPNQFLIRATGGVGINRNDPAVALDVEGAGRFTENLSVGGHLQVGWTISLGGLGVPGSTPLCLGPAQQISWCSSSLRYKTDVQPFAGGLDLVRRLRPITFAWRDRSGREVGFGAEQVAEVEPLLAVYNDAGQIEGVKYGQLTAVLVSAIQEQQAELARLRQMVEELRGRLEHERPSTVAVR